MQEKQAKKKVTEEKTFPVPFYIGEIQKDIVITTSTPNNLSEKQLINQAIKFHLQGDIEEALKLYKYCLDQGCNDQKVISNYGVILKGLGKFQEAEIYYRKAIELNPRYAMAHSNLGNILKDLGKSKEAEIYYRKAIELNPNFAEAYSNLGNILKDLGKSKEAEIYYRKAIELNPNFAEAHSNLGNILKDLGKFQEAEIYYRKAIKLNPNFAEAYSNLADILNDLDKYEEAKDFWLKAIELKSSLQGPIEQLARRLYLDRQYDLAIKYLQKNKSDICQSLYLSCLLCLNKEKEFDQKYQDLMVKKICNAEMSAIIEHANVVYERKNQSHFCNDAINYVFIEKINEELFSKNHCNQLISYLKSDEIETNSQPLIHEAIQTKGNLFSLDYPFIKSIKKALEAKIELYKTKFKDSEQGFIRNWPEDYTLQAWMLAMKTGGFIKPHNHRYGWITGSFYLQVPKTCENNNAGNISFSYQGPEYPVNNKNFNSTIKKIETRDICIFPSSLFHQTIPFKSQEDRICLVFDLIKTSTKK